MRGITAANLSVICGRCYSTLSSMGCLIQNLVNAQILGSVAELLDNETLLTVISHFSAFCTSITIETVERILRELVGCRWKLYYDTYVDHCNQILSEVKSPGGPSADHIRPVNTKGRYLWGAGYNLEFPSSIRHINGFVVKNRSHNS